MSEAKGWRLTRRTAGPQGASGLLLIAAALAGCRAGPPRDAPVSLSSGADGPDTRLTLQPAPDFRISVRPAPALELAGGTVVRFTGTALTTDSAYFAEPPTALLPGRHSRVHGTLRASVCQENEQICRSVKLEL